MKSKTTCEANRGPEKRKGDYMQTVGEMMFWPMDQQADEIYIGDIAHALAKQCRYAGHIRGSRWPSTWCSAAIKL
jgi:hypothetical protein